LKYSLLDSAESVDYTVPSLRIMRIDVEVAKQGKIAKTSDPIKKITVSQGGGGEVVDSGDEEYKLLRFVRVVREFDPDIIVTKGGDSYLFVYLVRRAVINGVLDKLVLGREATPLVARNVRGRTFFSYGRTFYRAPMRRLYGRVHVDERNTFILAECGLDGLFEIARTCRVSLHTAARSSIGSSMSSIQFYQAMKDGVLIPRNKSIPEAFKSAFAALSFSDWIGYLLTGTLASERSQAGESLLLMDVSARATSSTPHPDRTGTRLANTMHATLTASCTRPTA
jgi:DNA polymerase elongation subunit (family B)